jgi:hypothetical protein
MPDVSCCRRGFTIMEGTPFSFWRSRYGYGVLVYGLLVEYGGQFL